MERRLSALAEELMKLEEVRDDLMDTRETANKM